MEKNFNQWNEKKQNLHKTSTTVYFHEREIWFCHLGINVGFEQDGAGATFLRPVLVFKKFNNKIFLGIPLTKAVKNGIHYFRFSYLPDLNSTAILSQIRLIDGRRLKYKSGTMSEGDFSRLKKSFTDLIQ